MKRGNVSGFPVLCALWLPVGLPAATLPEPETVTVTGTRFESPVWTTPMRIEVIDADEIALHGADHLVNVLRGRAAVEVSDLFGDGSQASIGLRGFSATAGENTLIMVDGRRLNNADSALPDLTTVSIANIDRIELVQGSLGSLYGDKAVGGAINIVTRKPLAREFLVGMDLGSYRDRRLHLTAANRHDNGLAYRLSAHRQLDDNYRDDNALRQTDVSGRLEYRHASGLGFIEYQHLDLDRQLPGALFPDLLAEDRRLSLNTADSIVSRTASGRAGIEQSLGDRTTLYLEYTNRFNDIDGVISSAGTPLAFDSKRHHVEWTPRLVRRFTAPAGEGVWLLGADYFRTDYLIRSDFGITDDIQTRRSVYSRAVVPLLPGISLTGGVRHAGVHDDILVDTLAFGRSLPEGTILKDTATAWELGISYRPQDDWRVYLRIDENYRFVTADEYSAIADNNFFADLFGGSAHIPLPGTQHGRSLELGFDWQGGQTDLSGQIYRLDIRDEIVFDPALFLNTNNGDTRRDGVLLTARRQVTPRLGASLQYSYLDARYRSGPYTGRDLTFLAAHRAGADLALALREDLHLVLEGQLVGRRLLGGDFDNRYEALPAYALANLNLGWVSGPWRAGLRINNLFGHKYSDAGNIAFDFRQPFPAPQVETYYPAPGRHLMLSVSYHLE